MGGFVNLDENILGEVFGLGGVAQHPVDQIRDRLLVFVHQSLECPPVALLDAKHQTGIGVEVGRHGRAC